LKDSLAKTLAAYYPFAGRLIEFKPCVDCNDEGAEFQESRIKCTLSDFVKKYEDDLNLDMVFPPNSVWKAFDNGSSPLIVRVNYFECGGFAVAICMSHLIGDATTLSNFMKYWAAVTRETGDQVPPHVISSPSCDDNFEESIHPTQDYPTSSTRFVFMNPELAKLKSKICSSDGQNPTRFEFLSGLFYKCLMAVEISRSGSFRPSILYRPVNMRSKLALPKTTVGNVMWRSLLTTRTECESSWKGLLDEMKTVGKEMEGMKDLDVNALNSINGEIIQGNYKMYCCSGMHNMDFYKVNFGWGNPIRVAIGVLHVPGYYGIFDTPCENGIEVIMTYDELEMLKLELKKEVDALASLN
jgi:hypothetical protein